MHHLHHSSNIFYFIEKVLVGEGIDLGLMPAASVPTDKMENLITALTSKLLFKTLTFHHRTPFSLILHFSC
jgi:hypothetical protein